MSLNEFIRQCVAGIVSYNPKLALLKQCICSIYKQVSSVVIVDNGSQNVAKIEELCNLFPNVVLISLNRNEGIASALNLVARKTNALGCKWFLTLDQDSVCPDNMISEFFMYSEYNSVAMICPSILLRINKDKKKQNISTNFEYINVAITSGCLVKYDAWLESGGFWEYLFIDKVDDDFCFSLTANGYKIIRVNKVVLQHEIGKPKKRHFLGIGYYTDSYPAFRYYYIARNSFIYYKYTKQKGLIYLFFIKRLIKIIFGENRKTDKLVCFLKGFIDGIKWSLQYGIRGQPSSI